MDAPSFPDEAIWSTRSSGRPPAVTSAQEEGRACALLTVTRNGRSQRRRLTALSVQSCRSDRSSWRPPRLAQGVRAPVDEPEFRRWRDEAERALGAARREADAANHNWSCFLAEQAAQLAVKALLHGLGRAPWGHDLEALLQAVADAGVDVSEEVRAAARLLARHYIPARYPDAHPGSSPGFRYVSDDSLHALAAAELLLSFVDANWGSVA